MSVHLVPFLRYSASYNGVTLKSLIIYYLLLVFHCNIAMSCIIFELFDVKLYRDLEICVKDHWRLFKQVLFDSLGAVSYSPSIVTILHHFRDKARFFIPPCIRRPRQGNPRRNIAIPFGMEKLEWWSYPMMKKLWDRILACDGRTDGHLATV